MKVFHWQCPPGNFGDDLNLWLWDWLLPGYRDAQPDVLLVGVGTVLKQGLLPDNLCKLVIGSGVGYGAPPQIAGRRDWDVRCVRGPLSAEQLGLPAHCAATDPAVLVGDMPEFRNLPKLHDVLFVPHWQSAVHGEWAAVAKAAQIGYLSPCGDAKAVIRAIAQAKLVLAESLHAAIVADTLRVPWIAVKTHNDLHAFKWRDWTASLGLEYRPETVPPSTRAEAGAKSERFWGLRHSHCESGDEPASAAAGEPRRSVSRSIARRVLATPAVLALRQARQARPQLSSDLVLADRKERLRSVIADVKRDYLSPQSPDGGLRHMAGCHQLAQLPVYSAQ
ncbi:MAG TPA: polysaccharide pyruvyl transferase family protein [Kiloniellaceae bacterium]|nr:polysaccharide pyruvyl transferase family protein [Kiloniellaceae bacterium]